MNNNKEGNIESTPEINSPGFLVVMGYLECHTQVCPYNFDFLGLEVYDVVM